MVKKAQNALDLKRRRGRPRIHPDRKAYQAEWVRNKRSKSKTENP